MSHEVFNPFADFEVPTPPMLDPYLQQRPTIAQEIEYIADEIIELLRIPRDNNDQQGINAETLILLGLFSKQ